MNANRPQEVVERALAASRADGCVVIVEEETTAHLRWAGSALTTNGVSATRRVAVVAVVGRGTGAAAGAVSHTGAVDRDAIAALVATAEDAARQAAPAPDAQPLVPAGEASPNWTDPVPVTSIAVFQRVAPDLGVAFRATAGRGRLLYGFADHRARSTFLGTSTGIRLRYEQASGHLELTARTGDGAGSGWGCVPTVDFADVSVDELCSRIESRLSATRRLELPPGRYECLLPPAAVADLMSYVYWSAGARDAAQGQTVYSRAGGGIRIGERLSSVPLTLRSDPGAPGLECAPFVVATASDATTSVFDNGLPLLPTSWVDKGVLRALLQTRQTAADYGLPLTLHVDNLILEGPAPGASLDEMVAATERALLLTSLWYIREVDPQRLLLTGLTRDGVYLVEDGEIVGVVNNFRFNDSPVDMLSRVREVGVTEPTRAREWGDAFSRTAMPPLRVADFTMSSASQAI